MKKKCFNGKDVPIWKMKKMFLVMKITGILLLVFVMNLSATVYSQNDRFDIAVKNVSLKQVFKEITGQSNYSFMYSNNDVSSVKGLTVEMNNVKLKQILDKILKGTDLTFYIRDNVIVVRKMTPLEKKASLEQKKITVKGKVTDKDGNAMPGVSVFVKGTQTGVATDIDGNFEIKFAEKKGTVIVFSFVGMKTHEVTYKGQKELKVVLESDSEQLEEVVITGYQTLSKERATGSFQKIKSDDITRKSSANIVNTLEGMATGVLISNENNGDDLKIQIRGTSTFEADSDPLVVVDGFPIEGSINTINPKDIASIDILQDAAAASIYGVRAANGVIVVTTKSGAAGKTVVEFSTDLTFKTKPSISYLQLMDSETAVDLEIDYFNAGHIDFSTMSQYSNLSQVELLLKAGVTDKNDPRFEALRNNNGLKQYNKYLLDTGVEQSYNLSVKGGNENNKFFISGSFFDNKSIWKGDGFKRMIFSLNDNIKISEKLSAVVGMTVYSKSEDKNSPRLAPIISSTSNYSAYGIRPYDLLVDENGNRLPINAGYNQMEKERLVAMGYPYNWDYNLIDEMENMSIEDNKFETRFKAGLDYKVLDGLNVSTKMQYERRQYNKNREYSENTYYTRNLINETTLINGDDELEVQLPKGAIVDRTKSTYQYYNFRTQVDYNKTIGDHQITALLGNEVQKRLFESNRTVRYGYDERTLTTNTMMNWADLEEIAKMDGKNTAIRDRDRFYEGEDRFFSVYANFSYTYKERYTLTGSARIDQSNLFGVDAEYRRNPLWSLGGSWNISKEEFFKADFVDNLKLRLTYGFNGNIDPNASGFMIEKIGSGFDTFYNTQYGYITDPGNPLLRWEKTEITNVAVDFALFNNRISGSIEYYNKLSKDLFIDASINSTYGFTKQRRNDGEISNKGIDISLNAQVLKYRGFEWNTGVNFSYNKNEVLSTNVSADEIGNYIKEYWQPIEGRPLGRLYAYKWAGLSSNGDPQIYNGDGEVIDHLTAIEDPKALKYMGSTDPKYYGSFINRFSYKGFELTAMLTFKGGHVFRKPTSDYSNTINNWGHKDIANRWMKAGDEEFTNVPGIMVKNNGSRETRDLYFMNADINVEDASYVRFKELSLTYSLPSALLKKLPIARAKFRCNVQNLGMIWTASDSGYDPDYIPYWIVGGYSTSDPWYGKHPGLAPKPSVTFGMSLVF